MNTCVETAKMMSGAAEKPTRYRQPSDGITSSASADSKHEPTAQKNCMNTSTSARHFRGRYSVSSVTLRESNGRREGDGDGVGDGLATP